jgi:hypothetical protein
VSTLAELFAPGQRIPELDDDDLGELLELVLEETDRRGWQAVIGWDAIADSAPKHVGVSVGDVSFEKGVR